jgi:hypothetical protein
LPFSVRTAQTKLILLSSVSILEMQMRETRAAKLHPS